LEGARASSPDGRRRRAGKTKSGDASRVAAFVGILAAMNGVPMAIIAANLGHAGTRTTEKHYAHLSLSHVRDAIRAGAPKYGIRSENKIVPIHSQPALCDQRSVTIIWRWRRS
jgi:hypothetical protein